VCVCVCVYMYVCVCECMCVCLGVFLCVSTHAPEYSNLSCLGHTYMHMSHLLAITAPVCAPSSLLESNGYGVGE
jgi:hypothetical protein